MLNRVVIAGRLVRDPELRKTTGGTSVTTFTIAVDNLTKNDKGENTTSFFSCSIFGRAADSTSKYARKGLLVGVDGRLQQRTYERKDGTKASVVEIIADSVQFLESKKATDEATKEREELKENLF